MVERLTLYQCPACGTTMSFRFSKEHFLPNRGALYCNTEPAPLEVVRTTDLPPLLGDLLHPDWADYVATNLADALDQVPDTGDWHGALRAWCDRSATGRMKPNRPPAPDEKDGPA